MRQNSTIGTTDLSPRSQLEESLATVEPPPRRSYDLGPIDPHDTRIPEVKDRPWYMSREAQLRPEACPLDPDTGLRKATLLPEEAPGQDRVVDQLMYFPPK